MKGLLYSRIMSLSCACSHNVSLAIPVLESVQALSTHMEAAIAAETQRIRSSIAVHEGSIPNSSLPVGDIALASSISLLSPPACCNQALPSSADQQATVSGRVLLEGTLFGHAQVQKKDTWGAAVDMLKVKSSFHQCVVNCAP